MTGDNNESDILRSVLIEEAESGTGGHPGLEELTDYHHGSLEGDAEERVRDHLAACRPCAQQLLDLEPLMRPEEPQAAGVSDLEIEAAWRRFQEVAMAAETVRSAPRPRWATALAASLGAATLALGLWVVRLQQVNDSLRGQVVDAARPTVNLPVLYLTGVTRAEGTPEIAIEVPESAGLLAIFVSVTEPIPADEYEVRFLDDSDEEVLRTSGLVMNEDGGLRMALPRGRLEPGDYRILLRARRGGDWQTIEEYRSTIVHP